MAADSTERTALPWGSATVVLLVTLGVWMMFYLAGVPLDQGATFVVGLLATVCVAIARFAYGRWRPAAPASPKPASKP